jgi:hypothetical protein
MVKVKTKKRDVVALYQSIGTIKQMKGITPPKLVYAMERTVRATRDLAESIKAFQDSVMTDYNKDVEIAKEKSGGTKVIDYGKIDKDHAEAIKKNNDFMNEDCEIDVHKFERSKIPTWLHQYPGIVSGLLDMIVDDEEEDSKPPIPATSQTAIAGGTEVDDLGELAS